MDQAFASSRALESPRISALPNIAEIVLALLLAAGLWYGLPRGNGGDSYVVALADADSRFVVSLASVGWPEKKLAGNVRDASVAIAAKVEVSEPTKPWPARLRAMISGQDGTGGTAQALATVIGIASTYNPFRRKTEADIAPTASGEPYDPDAWTAAIQIDLRDRFGGVRYGRFYRPAFALVERGDKRAILKINDVGPLRPGRVIDLNEQSMRYFDPSLRLGLVHDVKITLLPGDGWTPGPVSGGQAVNFASAD